MCVCLQGQQVQMKKNPKNANTSAPAAPRRCCSTSSRIKIWLRTRAKIINTHWHRQSRRHRVSPHLAHSRCPHLPSFASCFMSWWVIALGLLNWDNPNTYTHARTHTYGLLNRATQTHLRACRECTGRARVHTRAGRPKRGRLGGSSERHSLGDSRAAWCWQACTVLPLPRTEHI